MTLWKQAMPPHLPCEREEGCAADSVNHMSEQALGIFFSLPSFGSPFLLYCSLVWFSPNCCLLLWNYTRLICSLWIFFQVTFVYALDYRSSSQLLCIPCWRQKRIWAQIIHLMSSFPEMEWTAKWDWENLMMFGSKVSGSPKKLQLKDWMIEDDE